LSPAGIGVKSRDQRHGIGFWLGDGGTPPGRTEGAGPARGAERRGREVSRLRPTPRLGLAGFGQGRDQLATDRLAVLGWAMVALRRADRRSRPGPRRGAAGKGSEQASPGAPAWPWRALARPGPARPQIRLAVLGWGDGGTPPGRTEGAGPARGAERRGREVSRLRPAPRLGPGGLWPGPGPARPQIGSRSWVV